MIYARCSRYFACSLLFTLLLAGCTSLPDAPQASLWTEQLALIRREADPTCHISMITARPISQEFITAAKLPELEVITECVLPEASNQFTSSDFPYPMQIIQFHDAHLTTSLQVDTRSASNTVPSDTLTQQFYVSSVGPRDALAVTLPEGKQLFQGLVPANRVTIVMYMMDETSLQQIDALQWNVVYQSESGWVNFIVDSITGTIERTHVTP